MSVSSASVFTPHEFPVRTSARARALARPSSRMKAPLPVFTSRTSAPSPAASFFDMIEATMSGIDSTVSVASLSA